MLNEAGWDVGTDRVQRIWRREGLKVPWKQKPRGRLWLNDGPCIRLRPERRNHVWSYDFVEAQSGDDYDATLAERYGWINRALPARELDAFVVALAHRIAKHPVNSLLVQKERVNTIALPSAVEFRRDAEIFVELARSPGAQAKVRAAMKLGFQNREGERVLAEMLSELGRR